MKFVKKHSLLMIFIIGLLLRLLLLFYDYSWDINNHIAWAKDLYQRGFMGFYETQSSEVYASLFPNYPPLSSFIFYIFYSLQTVIEKTAWEINLAFPLFPSKLIFFIQSRTFLAALMKIPAIFADLGIAWIVYLFSKKLLTKNQLTNKLLACLVLFNPAFFYTSALWGQIDSIPIFFVLFSIYFLFYSNKYLVSSLFFTLAVLIKPTALIYLPVYLIYFIQKWKLINFLKAALFGILIFYVSFIPFLKNLDNLFLPASIFSEKIMAAQSLPYVTNGAFNFWVLIKSFAGIKDTAPFLFGISYRLWGYFITGFLTILILWSFWTLTKSGNRILKRSYRSLRSLQDDEAASFFYATFLIAFAAFLFLTKMHERYSLLPLPFLLLSAIKDKKLLKWFVILSLISLLNLYHSWPVPKLGVFTTALYLTFVTWSLSFLNILTFLYLLSDFVKISHHADNRRSSASF